MLPHHRIKQWQVQCTWTLMKIKLEMLNRALKMRKSILAKAWKSLREVSMAITTMILALASLKNEIWRLTTTTLHSLSTPVLTTQETIIRKPSRSQKSTSHQKSLGILNLPWMIRVQRMSLSWTRWQVTDQWTLDMVPCLLSGRCTIVKIQSKNTLE